MLGIAWPFKGGCYVRHGMALGAGNVRLLLATPFFLQGFPQGFPKFLQGFLQGFQNFLQGFQNFLQGFLVGFCGILVVSLRDPCGDFGKCWKVFLDFVGSFGKCLDNLGKFWRVLNSVWNVIGQKPLL